ncbi:site-specific integrase [Nanchangia anserum]|uniref:Site-specific integrase n=1 Tax=Nanchangia anserum TaxID=2692125 RepID=A0A8I0KWD0_9ACTO|nr:site-specific integrase [Nanchangia anserum]MBD3689889.1 site-specific integrase [Nanchangia anserum]QOX82059.1 site-specific integrase [Nanchangia anserum]
MIRATRWGSIVATRQGRYEASHADPERPGKRRYKTFTRKRDAESWLAAQRVLIERGEWQAPGKPAKNRRVSVLEYSKQWLNDLEAAGRSANTLRTYGTLLRVHILPTFGDTALKAVNEDDIRAWLQSFPRERARTRVNAYNVFRSLLSAAVDAGLLERVPRPVKGATAAPPLNEDARAARERIASPEQVDAIAARMPDRLAIAVYLAAWCGLRYGEVAGLERRDVDMAAGVVKVRRAVKRDPRGALVVGPPKSERSRRDVPIPPRIRDTLAAHMSQHVGQGARALVVSSATGTHLSNRTLLHAYRPAVDAVAGLKGFGFHQLRATCASQLMATGATPVEIMAILGHSDWSTSLLYQRTPRERLAAAMERLSDDAL